MSELVIVRRDDLRLLMEYAGKEIPADDSEHELNQALARCEGALGGSQEDASPFAAATTPEPGSTPGVTAVPEGEFSRVELPGYVSWTGWVTEETFAGAGVLVVRDISGTVLARVSAGAFRQVMPLPLPKPGASHYDGQLALTAGDEDGEDAWANDEGGEAY